MNGSVMHLTRAFAASKEDQAGVSPRRAKHRRLNKSGANAALYDPAFLPNGDPCMTMRQVGRLYYTTAFSA
jgi:hypothetical protein